MNLRKFDFHLSACGSDISELKMGLTDADDRSLTDDLSSTKGNLRETVT